MIRRFATALTLAACVATLNIGSIEATAQDQAAQPPVRYDGHKVVRANIRNARQLRIMETLSPDCWSHGSGIGLVDYRIPPEALDALAASGVEHEVLIEDVQALIEREKGVGQPAGWYDQYHTLAEIEQYVQGLADSHPNLAQTFVVGNSLEGRPIRGIRISGAGGPNGKPDFVIHGGIHAREWITTMAMPYMIETLLTSYGNDPVLTQLVDRVNFHIVSVMNVDGFLYTQTDRMWRKNRRNNGNGTYGVDLNRNYSVGWGGEGSSSNTGSETYRGTAPFSEPESQVMRDWQLSLPNFAGFIDVHSYSQLILQPYGYTSQLPPDHATFEMIGANMENVMEDLHGTGWVHGPTYTTIYPASGVTLDWAYVEGGAWGMSFELRDTGQFGFLLPPEQIIPASQECFVGAMELAKFLSNRLAFAFPNGLPTWVDPNTAATIEVQINPINGGSYQTGSAKVYARVGTSGPFVASSMAPQGGNLFLATLPAADCGEIVQFYFEAYSTDNVQHTSPVGAPTEFYAADSVFVDVIFADDFQTNQGWTVQNENLQDGAWERGVPAGGGAREDPPSDFDGSGSCFLTANRSGNSDVDGGPTRLISPTFDLSGGDATISYARWFRSVNGTADRFTVDISNDNGSTWTNVENLGNQPTQWGVNEFQVSNYLAPTATMKIRFNAVDVPNDSVVEAGVDAVLVARRGCGGGGGMTLAVGPLNAGQNGQFDVTDANPNELTYLAYSLRGLGSTYVPGLNVTLDLRSPVQAGTARRSDGSGSVSWTLPIPPNASGRTVWFQAAQFENKSNVVETTIN